MRNAVTIERMFDSLKGSIESVRELVVSLEPKRLRPADAAELVSMFAELERLAVSGRTIAGRRVDETKFWRTEGHRTPGEWMAARAQTTLSSAISTIETGRRIEALPAVRDAFATGSLSAQQASHVSAAAAANPASEEMLLAVAARESIPELQRRCREVIADATLDGDRDARVYRSRYLRQRVELDSAHQFELRVTADSGARLLVAVNARARRYRDEAVRSGLKPEPLEAYRADALMSLLDEGTVGPTGVVHVHVDYDAWVRGNAEEGENCSIPGLGAIPVPAARRLAGKGLLKVVLIDEGDVRGVLHLGRAIPARVRTAIEARDQTCSIERCDSVDGLEPHHIIPFAEGGPTTVDNLTRLCREHHKMVTFFGWQLEGRHGAWKLVKAGRRGRPPD